MSGNQHDTILLCQSDKHRGCSVCCGLFNFANLSRQNLSRYLIGGTSRVCNSASFHREPGLLPEPGAVRDEAAHICPYQGFLSEATRPGCLLHPQFLREDCRNRSLFGAEICGNFLCPAHHILGNRYKQALTELVKDWYAYSAAIADPETFIWIMDLFWNCQEDSIRKKDTEEKEKEIPERVLLLHARFLSKVKGPVFYYSVSEYNLHKHRFSVTGASAVISGHQRKLDAEIRKLLS